MVAILDGRFAYFCSAACKQAAAAQSIVPPRVAPKRVAPEPVFERIQEPVDRPPRDDSPHDSHDDDRWEPELHPDSASIAPVPDRLEESLAPAERDERDERDAPIEPPESSERFAPSALPAPVEDGVARGLRVLALVLAAAAVAIALVDARASTSRLTAGSAACVLLVGLWLASLPSLQRGARHPVAAALEADLGGPSASGAIAATSAIALAWALLLLRKPGAATATSAAVWVVLAASAAELVAHLVMRGTLADARAVLGPLVEGSAVEPHIGEISQLGPGDRVRSDVRVVEGELVIEQWGLADLRVRRRADEAIAGGAIVREGTARARVVAVGRSRAFARLLFDAVERSDRASPGLRTLDGSAPWLIGAVVVLAIVIGIVSKGRVGPTLVAGMAAGASILVTPARRLAVREQLRGIVEAARRGAAFRDGDAFARAGSVRTAIFCARGTVLSSAPDACDVEELGPHASATDVLALAAGAERGVEHPLSQAIARAAAAREVRPVDLRNVTYEPGLGVRGELASGQVVAIGGRQLCLREHVPTAEHEARIEELERIGREVLLVARGGRLIGLLVMQYPLRAGALAAVQRVEDVEVEPVLLGGGARARLEAVGRALGVEHVRPEIGPAERAAEVRRIAQSSGPVAVMGRMPRDAAALGAADVAIALDDAGTAPDAREEGRAPPSIALMHHRLVSAVDVLALAQATRARVGAALLVGLAPVALAALPVAFGLVRPSWAPLAALAATVALAVRELVAAALPEGGHFDETR